MTNDPDIIKQAEKIFVDSDEEIIFTIEKIRSSTNKRILLIVPQHALLVSSIVNIKLLSRQVAFEDKLVIIITQNELAKNKMQETSILSVEKPEQVNEQMWEKAFMMISSLKDERKAIKEKLLSARKETVSDQDDHPILEEEAKTTETENEEEIEPILKSHRMQPKKIEVGPFSVFAGGDIAKLKIKPETQNNSTQPKPQTNIAPKQVFTGINLKNVQSSYKLKKAETYQRQTPSRFQSVTKVNTRGNQAIDLKKYSKYAKYTLILIIPFLLLIFVNRIFTKVTIEITPKTQPKTISDTLIADANVSTIDMDRKIIPAKVITKDKSGSESAPTTGTSQKGELASGTVYVYNKTDKEITLEPGHKITSLNDTSLSFELTRQITIPKRVSELTRSEYEDAPIKAVDYGEKYNIGGHDVQIDGFPTTELSGRIYSKLRGGNSQEVRSVSQDDVSKLKEALQGNLESVLKNEIQNSLAGDDILIDQTKKTQELAFEFYPAIDEESPTFDITKLEIQMSIYTVSQEDIDILTEKFISMQSDENIDISSNKEAKISNIMVKENGTIEFDISKEVKTSSYIDEDEVKKQIAGKSIEQTESILSELEAIATFEIKYSPFLIPSWMRKVPSNSSKIVINVNK